MYLVCYRIPRCDGAISWSGGLSSPLASPCHSCRRWSGVQWIQERGSFVGDKERLGSVRKEAFCERQLFACGYSCDTAGPLEEPWDPMRTSKDSQHNPSVNINIISLPRRPVSPFFLNTLLLLAVFRLTWIICFVEWLWPNRDHSVLSCTSPENYF